MFSFISKNQSQTLKPGDRSYRIWISGRFEAARNNCGRNSAGTIYAPAVPAGTFKKCCVKSGRFDRSLSRRLNLRGFRLHFRCATPLLLWCDCGRLTGGVSGLGRRGPQKPVSKETVSRAFLGLRPIARVFACVEFWHCRLHALLKDLSSEFILRACRSACRKGLNLILPGRQQSHSKVTTRVRETGKGAFSPASISLYSGDAPAFGATWRTPRPI
jgi:hypothetical protein